MQERCVAYPFLAICAKTRPWAGKVSASQGAEGIRSIVLKYLFDYYESPVEQAFRVLGSSAHSLLEEHEGEGFSEIRLENDFVSGQFDYFDWINGILYDFKTFGSYKVRKILGLEKKQVVSEEVYTRGYTPPGLKPLMELKDIIVETGENSPLVEKLMDYITEQEAGKKEKGDIKMKTIWVPNPELVDMRSEILQMNCYRYLAETIKNWVVNEIRLNVFVRDGGTQNAFNNGVDRNVYNIQIPIISNDEIISVYSEKTRLVTEYIGKNVSPPVACDDSECWDGIKCQRFCPVAQYCDKGREYAEKN